MLRRQFLKLIGGSAIAAVLPLPIISEGSSESVCFNYKVKGLTNPALMAGRALKDAGCKIEPQSFYRWADYCDEQKLVCENGPDGGSVLDHLASYAEAGNALVKCEDGIFIAIILSKIPQGPYKRMRSPTCDYTIGVGEEVVFYKGFAYNAIQFPEAKVGDNIYICTKTVYLPPEERRKRHREGSIGEVEAVLAIKAYTSVGY